VQWRDGCEAAAALPTAIGNSVLVDVGFVLRFEWDVLALACATIGAERFDFSLKAADLLML
jgi:hypothetical protein